MLTPEEIVRLEEIERQHFGVQDDNTTRALWLCSTVREQAQRIERLERVLAAEQGREGLEGWRNGIVDLMDCLWYKSDLPDYEEYGIYAEVNSITHWPKGTESAKWRVSRGYEDIDHEGTSPTALEAMEAAEAALRGEG